MDPVHVEKVEAELDQFIEKRAREAKDAEKVEELWAASERKERRKRRQRNGWAWIDYHQGLARFHRDLAHEHEDRAEHVRELLTAEALLAKPPSRNGNHQTQSGGEKWTSNAT